MNSFYMVIKWNGPWLHWREKLEKSTIWQYSVKKSYWQCRWDIFCALICFRFIWFYSMSYFFSSFFFVFVFLFRIYQFSQRRLIIYLSINHSSFLFDRKVAFFDSVMLCFFLFVKILLFHRNDTVVGMPFGWRWHTI